MDTPSLTDAVRRALLADPQVSEATHRFEGVVFHLGRRELGHLHGDRVADLPLPAPISAELVASGRLRPTDVDAASGWVSRTVGAPQDVEQIVELFRLSYEHAAAQAALDGDGAHDRPAQVRVDDQPQRASWRELLAVPVRGRRRRR